MKTAREMFEELWYTFQESYDYEELIFKKGGEHEEKIVFNLSKKTFAVYDWNNYIADFEPHSTTLQELVAINQMVKELGWNE